MCQMPHRLARVTIPKSLPNCKAMMPSARPEFCMPPSIMMALRSRSLMPMDLAVAQPKNRPLALCNTTIKKVGKRPSVSNCRSLMRPATMNKIKALTAKLPSGLRMRCVRAGSWCENSKPSASGMPRTINKLSQMPDGSIDNSRSHDAVSGLAAIIQLKLKGVANSAIKLATAEMLTDKAVLPRPKWVTTLLRLPPGQAATKIMAASTLAGKSSASVASQVPTGSKMNWGISPHSTAFGA